jgi:hypothetical protein
MKTKKSKHSKLIDLLEAEPKPAEKGEQSVCDEINVKATDVFSDVESAVDDRIRAIESIEAKCLQKMAKALDEENHRMISCLPKAWQIFSDALERIRAQRQSRDPAAAFPYFSFMIPTEEISARSLACIASAADPEDEN